MPLISVITGEIPRADRIVTLLLFFTFFVFLGTNVRGLPPLTLLSPQTYNDPYSHRAFNAHCGFPTLNLITQRDHANANTQRILTVRIANLVRNNVR